MLPAGWCFVSWLISHLGGWQRLVAVYAARTAPTGQQFHTYGRVGTAWDQGSLYVHVASDGLFVSVMLAFRIGHEPLFIPWSEIHNRQTTKLWWREGVELDIGAPCVGAMWLPKKVFETQYFVN